MVWYLGMGNINQTISPFREEKGSSLRVERCWNFRDCWIGYLYLSKNGHFHNINILQETGFKKNQLTKSQHSCGSYNLQVFSQFPQTPVRNNWFREKWNQPTSKVSGRKHNSEVRSKHQSEITRLCSAQLSSFYDGTMVYNGTPVSLP